MYSQVIENGKYVLRDGNQVIEHADAHCIKPYQFGDWLFYVKTRNINRLVAVNLVTGIIKEFSFFDVALDYEPPAFDGRFVAFVGILTQGKVHWPNTVWALVFDTQTAAVLPPSYPLYREASGLSVYFCKLWAAVGHEACSVTCSVTPGFLFQWSITRFEKYQAIAKQYERWQCTINQAGVCSEPLIAETSIAVPEWL